MLPFAATKPAGNMSPSGQGGFMIAGPQPN
jgi:hypothetical protein